jgi:hypothetical protein
MAFPDNLQMLDKLIERYFAELMKTKKVNAKLGDLIKMIDLRRKLAPDDADQKQFWRMLDKIRKEALPSGKTRRRATARQNRSKGSRSNTACTREKKCRS